MGVCGRSPPSIIMSSSSEFSNSSSAVAMILGSKYPGNICNAIRTLTIHNGLSSQVITYHKTIRRSVLNVYSAECGGYAMRRLCPICEGKCGREWIRDVGMVCLGMHRPFIVCKFIL